MQNLLGAETDLFGLDWIERFLEWDFLSTGVSDLAVESIGNETVDGLTAELGRDNYYGVMASLRGHIKQDVFERLILDRRIALGEELPTFAIVCTDGPRSIVLSNSAIISTNSAWSLSGNMPPQIEMEVAVGSVVRFTGNPEAPPAAATDWYLNGPVLGTFIWPRPTERRYHGRYVRTRTCSNGESPILVRYPPADDLVHHSTSLDHLLVTLSNMRVIVSKVPEQFTPNWSAGLGLEFRQDLGGIQDVETRKAIAEALSFLLGRQLLHIGFTSFDSLGQPLEEQAVDPWGDDVVATCQAPGWPPLFSA